MATYPYDSSLKEQLKNKVEGIDYRLWQSEGGPDFIASTSKPIVEIGGPTQDGFYFLDGLRFNSELIITNISTNPMPLSPDASELAKEVNKIFDATNIPYDDNSIGVFLMAAMSISSDWWIELSHNEKEKAAPTFETEFANAQFEMGQVAAGILSCDCVKDAQRVKIYQEIHRCLLKDGLFFTDGGIEEITILRQLGFELIACLQVAEDYGIRYEFVVAKRF